jgi:Tfp pilus assembly protein PilF
MLRTLSFIAVMALAMALAGCATKASWTPDVEHTGSIDAASPALHPTTPPTTSTMRSPWDVRYFRSDEPLKLAQEYFNRGDFGNAERYFREAAEKAPQDPLAWLGLAASYDRLARFDLAAQAYDRVQKICGESPELLNNLGYSYMLQGKLKTAQVKFEKALSMDPVNPVILNNMRLLEASYQFIQQEE